MNATVDASHFTVAAYGQMLAVHAANAALSGTSEASFKSNLGYSGEQWDVSLRMQNLRARVYDPRNGRFIGLDPFAGNMQDPQSLHKYAYVHGDPVQGTDPSGKFNAISVTITAGIMATAGATFAVVANGVRNKSQGHDFWQGSASAAKNGAVLGVVAGLSPIVGVGLALWGIYDSFTNLDSVLSKEDATDEEKRYAYGYVALTVVGGFLAGRGTVHAARGGRAGVVYNPKAFQGISFRQSAAKMLEQSRAMWNFARTFPGWYNKQATVALGLLRHKTSGSFKMIALSNQTDGVIPPGYDPIIPNNLRVGFNDSTIPPTPKIHAETRIDAWAAQNGYEVVGKGASNGICDACATKMASNGEHFFGPLQSRQGHTGTSMAELNMSLGFNPSNVVGAGIAGGTAGPSAP